MWDLPLNALRAFAAIHSTGGVRAAARRLDIAHSSVSRHLVELESWLGLALIEREPGRRGLRFTVHGDALGAAALASLGELATAVAALREVRSASSVQIGTAPSFAARWLLPRLPDLEASHPGIELSIVVDRRQADLPGTDLDMAISMGPRRTLGRHWRPLMGDRLYPVMSPEYWRRHGRPSRPEQLAGLRLLHDRDPDAAWSEWRSLHGPAALDVSKGPRFTSTDLVLRAAANGQGVALARHQLAREDVAAGTLFRPLGDLSVELDEGYWIILPRHQLPTPAARTVVAWLEREAAMP